MSAIQFRDDMTVRLVRSAATDADVLFAARVSTLGSDTDDTVGELGDRDKGLINYLMRDRHGSAMEHNSMTFYIEAPIFVARQMMRHRIASWNEASGRYMELAGVYYVPSDDRRLVQEGKPGAYTFTTSTEDQTALAQMAARRIGEVSWGLYQDQLNAGIAREVARGVLPVNLYTSFYMTMNARSVMHLISLRTTGDAASVPSFPQAEIEEVGRKVEAIFAGLMPVTHAAFVRHGRRSP